MKERMMLAGIFIAWFLMMWGTDPEEGKSSQKPLQGAPASREKPQGMKYKREYKESELPDGHPLNKKEGKKAFPKTKNKPRKENRRTTPVVIDPRKIA